MRTHLSSPGEPTSRRRLLTLVGAGGAAVLAALVPRNGVRAGHDSTDVLHLGQANSASAETRLDANAFPHTLLVSTADQVAIRADSAGGIGLLGSSDSFRGVYGKSDTDAGVRGDSLDGAGIEGHGTNGPGGSFSSDNGFALAVGGRAAIGGSRSEFLLAVDNEDDGETAGGIYAISRGGKPAVEGDAFESDFGPGIGLQGVSGGGETFAQGPGIGVQGLSGSGVGVEGQSQTWFGVRGVSTEHVGVIGESVQLTGVAGQSAQYVGLFGEAPNHTAIVGWGSTGILATSHGGPSDSPTSPTAGVAGAAPGDVPGVLAMSAFANPEIPKEPKVPDQVDGLVTDGGLALEVVGKARFSTAGNGSVPFGDNSVTVSNEAVTASSHISLTLHGDPGPRQLKWVERHAGSGFTVHFGGGPPGQRPEVPFSYLIVEPAA